MAEKEIKTEDTVLTDEQVTKVYNELESKGENTNKDKLEEAEKLTENSEYEEVKPMENQGVGTPQINEEALREAGLSDEYIEELKSLPDVDTNIKETEADYKELFKEYGITDEDAIELLKIIMQYKNDGVVEGLYHKLPPTVKNLADGLVVVGKGENLKVSKDNAAKVLIDSFINDAKFSASIDDFNEEMNNLVISTSKEYKVLMNEYIEEMYKDIDKIRTEDPEKAETLEKIKKAFEDAEKFTRELDYLDHTSAKKLKKVTQNSFDNECFYFNKKVNATEIKLPNIENAYPIIKKALPGFTELQIKEFIITICKASYDLDVNKIEDLAYIYRAVENIFAFRVIDMVDFNSDFAKQVFGNVSVVIKKIINL